MRKDFVLVKKCVFLLLKFLFGSQLPNNQTHARARLPVHAFPEGLPNEVALVDDFVRGAQWPEGLLGHGGDVVRRARLQVFGVNHLVVR